MSTVIDSTVLSSRLVPQVDPSVIVTPLDNQLTTPLQDAPGFSSATSCVYNFGSPHANGFNAVFCDGSVHTLSYNIDLMVLGCLGNRMDGKVIAKGAF